MLAARLASSWEENPLQTLIDIFARRDPLGKGDAPSRMEKKSADFVQPRTKDQFLLEYQWLIQNHPEVALKNLLQIPFYGTWKDLVKLAQVEPSILGPIANLFAVALDLDLACLHESEKPSTSEDRQPLLLTTVAKYTPRKGLLAREIAARLTYLGPIPPYRYGEYLRKRFLVPLRKALDILEVKKCARKWGKISYSGVPKTAHRLSSHQFFEHDQERYSEWLSIHELPSSAISSVSPHRRYERISL